MFDVPQSEGGNLLYVVHSKAAFDWHMFWADVILTTPLRDSPNIVIITSAVTRMTTAATISVSVIDMPFFMLYLCHRGFKSLVLSNRVRCVLEPHPEQINSLSPIYE